MFSEHVAGKLFAPAACRPNPAPVWNPFALLRVWQNRICERDALAGLDQRLRADIGVSAETAAQETSKPFWMA